MDLIAGAPVALPTQAVFSRRVISVDAPSGAHYTLRELSGTEQRKADSVSMTGSSDSIYYRIGMAIDTIGDERIIARETKAMVDTLLDNLPGADVEYLAREYVKAFAPHLLAAEIKN